MLNTTEVNVTIHYIAASRLPTPWATFIMHGFEDTDTGKDHVVLTLGAVDDGQPVLARVHSECLTGDALFSMRCDCGYQLQAALKRIAEEGRGALLYLRQEGVLGEQNDRYTTAVMFADQSADNPGHVIQGEGLIGRR